MIGMCSFAIAKAEFDEAHAVSETTACIVPVNGKLREVVAIRDVRGKASEEYYKWQFIHTLVRSGLCPSDHIGAEVQFPKGNSAPLRLDAAIFDDPEWIDRYNAFWQYRRSLDLEWLNEHLLAIIEFKRNDKELEKVFTAQIKPALREKEPAGAYVMGFYYGAERLYLFHRRNGKYLRYNETLNQKGDLSKAGDLSLHLPDPYILIPSMAEIQKRVHRPSTLDRSKRGIGDLDPVTGIASVQMQSAFSNVLRALDKAGLVVRSAETDLYQLIFYNFANQFKRAEAAQFLTPLTIIDFIVQLVNPRRGEKVIDPCCGIGDFLSLSFVNLRRKAPALWLNDKDIHGIDVDTDMIRLAR